LAVAVFDHGNAPSNVSDRAFRFEYLTAQIQAQNRLSTFAFKTDEIPAIMTRMQAVRSRMPDRDIPMIVMDTAPAAVLGALHDSLAQDTKMRLIANIGNFHCLAFRMGANGIEGMFEHHTGEINAAQLEIFLDRLADGQLTNDEIFESNGHGAVLFESFSLPLDQRGLIVTGPRRGMLRGSRYQPYFAAPFGDMMLAGCYGLIEAFGDLHPEMSPVIADTMGGLGSQSLW